MPTASAPLSAIPLRPWSEGRRPAGPWGLRGALLWTDAVPSGCTADLRLCPSGAHQLEDGLLVIENDTIIEAGPATALLRSRPGLPVDDRQGSLLVPGFVDTHVHAPQVDVTASYGAQLLDWLERYTFPTEAGFADPARAAAEAEAFVELLLDAGTTTAMTFATVHAHTATSLFGAAAARGLQLLTGPVWMDQHCPPALQVPPAISAARTAALIESWHGQGRAQVVLTPRFVPSCSREALALCAAIAAAHPTLPIQSHVAENRDEVAWVASLFPEARSYLEVYDRYGLLRPGAIYAHCIYLDDTDRRRMAESGAAAAFCPSSNLFLGSGLFDVAAARAAGMAVGLGSDVGGGTSLSQLRTLGDAYKVLNLQGQPLHPAVALDLATRAGAEALGLPRTGSFRPGDTADVVALQPGANPLLQRRWAQCRTPLERFFVAMTLGDEACVGAVWAAGLQRRGATPA